MKEKIENLNQNGEHFIVKFTAKWCGGCRQLQPTIDILKNSINIIEFDVDSDVNFPTELGIRSIPTLIFYKNGVETDRIVGLTTKDKILETFNK